MPARVFLERYCAGCHNTDTKTAGIAFDELNVENVSEDTESWEKVVRKLTVRAMPPIGAPRPEEAGYAAFLQYLESRIDERAAGAPNPGRTNTFHRLNRTEYRNAIRDLLALQVDDISALLPKDDESFGFDNVNVTELSSDLMVRYISAAEKIGHLAVGSPVVSPRYSNVELPADLTQESELEAMPMGTRGGTVFRYTFPLDGDYDVEIRLARDRDEQLEGVTEPHQMEITLDGRRLHLITVQPDQAAVPGSSGGDTKGIFTVRIPVQAGPRAVGVTFLKRPSALPETERQPYLASFNLYRHPRTQPAIYRVSVAGPFNPAGPGETPSRQRIFVCRPEVKSKETQCARTIISTVARRAWRRTVSDAELEGPLNFYRTGYADGGFEAGIEMALRAILVSPHFLFRIDEDPSGVPANTVYRIGDFELASRLSFFLWSSIPDDELLNIAAAGRLRSPEILERQVRRMLADRRSDALVENFAGQWLQLRNLAAASPFPRAFPEFDDNLRQAFRRETELFFASIKDENRSVLDLLRANYTFLNERLARHYGIPNVYGSRFRRVALEEESPRRGLLGHGSLLTVTSYATRTAPTLRGKWILENIVGSPPPPPPVNVPPLVETAAEGKMLPMRERLAQHRTNPSCSGCHQLMDPVGLSLENFDATGRWRVAEGNSPIDATGYFADGAEFNGVAGLRNALLQRPEPFVRTITGKLLTYALGRSPEYPDASAVRGIVRDASRNNYEFGSIILGIVKSTPFQMRRSR